MKKAVVIGAGQTGRGYVTRFLFQRDYEITFLDKNEELIRMLSEDRAFCIHFYKKDRTPIYVNGFHAYPTYSKKRPGNTGSRFHCDSTGKQNWGMLLSSQGRYAQQAEKDCLSNSGKRYQSG
ncbi:MAG: hypothetical protein ACLRL6_07495 [Clostridium sp.]